MPPVLMTCFICWTLGSKRRWYETMTILPVSSRVAMTSAASSVGVDHRLLDQHVCPGAERGDDLGMVERVGRGDDHGIGLHGVEHLLVVGERGRWSERRGAVPVAPAWSR